MLSVEGGDVDKLALGDGVDDNVLQKDDSVSSASGGIERVIDIRRSCLDTEMNRLIR